MKVKRSSMPLMVTQPFTVRDLYKDYLQTTYLLFIRLKFGFFFILCTFLYTPQSTGRHISRPSIKTFEIVLQHTLIKRFHLSFKYSVPFSMWRRLLLILTCRQGTSTRDMCIRSLKVCGSLLSSTSFGHFYIRNSFLKTTSDLYLKRKFRYRTLSKHLHTGFTPMVT